MDIPPRTYKEAWLSYKSNRCLKSNSNNTNSSLQVLRGLDNIRDRSDSYLEYAMYVVGESLSVLEGYSYQRKGILDHLCHLYENGELYLTEINHFINSKFFEFSINGALKLSAASQAISIFKKLKEITLSVIFTTTRNFSIQKDLSISA